MKRKVFFAGVLIVALAAGYFGYRAYVNARGRARTRAIEAAVRAQQGQAPANESLQTIVVTGQFVRQTENTISVRIAEEVTTDGRIFINYQEWTGVIGNETEIFRYTPAPTEPNGVRVAPELIENIRPDETVTVYFRQNAPESQVTAIHVLY